MSSQPQTAQQCPACGAALRPGARFCPECGRPVTQTAAPAVTQGESAQAVASQAPRIQGEEPDPGANAPPTTAAPGDAASQEPPGELGAGSVKSAEAAASCQVLLQAVPPAVRFYVQQALRQLFGLDSRGAQAYIAAAPVLLATGLTPEQAEQVRAALAQAGALVAVQGASPAEVTTGPTPEPEPEPEPEPVHRIGASVRVIRGLVERPGLRTVTGLSTGNTCSYVAHARAQGRELLTNTDMIRCDGRTAIPAVLRPAGAGLPLAFGSLALDSWPAQPQLVHLGLLEAIGQDDGTAKSLMRIYLQALAQRTSDVLGAGALDFSQGAATYLGVPADWGEDRAALLAQAATEAGFAVVELVPEPLAAIAHHLQQGTLRPPRRREWLLVVDWGGQGLRLSFVERGGKLAEPMVFEHLELPLGGAWYDAALEQWLLEHLPAELEDEDRRSLSLFAREFKEQLSQSFADGRPEHAQYCVIPAGAPPTRLRLSRADFEALCGQASERLGAALVEAVQRVGLRPTHLQHIVLVGGSARWYFAREAIRTSLGRVPLIGPHPEEAIARGLVACMSQQP